MTATQRIQGVWGIPYGREGDSEQDGYAVGGSYNVSKIEVREENLGTYGIKWYDVYDKEGNLKASFNALGVQSVIYFPPEQQAANNK